MLGYEQRSNIDVYLISEKDGTTFHFPVNPIDVLPIDYKKNYQTHEIINRGEYDFHKFGPKIDEIRFKTVIAQIDIDGVNRSSESNVDRLREYMLHKEACRLIITGFDYNDRVYLVDLKKSMKAGSEEARFLELKFRSHRDIKVKSLDTSKQNKINKGLNKTDRATSKMEAGSYTIKKGDCLWNIAKKKLGKGSRWKEIYDLNKKMIGPDPNKLTWKMIGKELKMPKK